MNLLERARELVCSMNEYEARRLDLRNTKRSVQTWPEWARRDFKLACDALVATRSEAIDTCAKRIREPQSPWMPGLTGGDRVPILAREHIAKEVEGLSGSNTQISHAPRAQKGTHV